MKIGIDISQIAFPHQGVSNYLTNLVSSMINQDKENEYVLFFSSMRKQFPISNFQFPNKSQIKNLQIKTFKIPPILLNILWNRLHVMPIEIFIGDVDIFITSDWTEPPTKSAKKATILYDLIVYKHPEETDKRIIETQKRKLEWVKKESDVIFCISEATKKDAIELLGIEGKRLVVIYPGI